MTDVWLIETKFKYRGTQTEANELAQHVVSVVQHEQHYHGSANQPEEAQLVGVTVSHLFDVDQQGDA